MCSLLLSRILVYLHHQSSSANQPFSLEIIQNGFLWADGWLLSSLLLQQHPSQFYLHLHRSHPWGFLLHRLLFGQVLILFRLPVLSFPHQLLSQFHALVANQLQSQEAILVLLVPDRRRGYQGNNPHTSDPALMDTWTEEIPESGVSRGPFELVLFVQMNSEAVASGKTLITYMALVASSKPPLVSHQRKTLNDTFGKRTHKDFIFSRFSPHALVYGEVSWCSGRERWSCSQQCHSEKSAHCYEYRGVCASQSNSYTLEGKREMAEMGNEVQAAYAGVASEQQRMWHLYSQQSQVYGLSLLCRNLMWFRSADGEGQVMSQSGHL